MIDGLVVEFKRKGKEKKIDCPFTTVHNAGQKPLIQGPIRTKSNGSTASALVGRVVKRGLDVREGGACQGRSRTFSLRTEEVKQRMVLASGKEDVVWVWRGR